MFCPRCGKPLPQGASFCMNCGQPLAAVRPVERPTAQPAYPGAAAYPAAIPKKNKYLWPTAIGLLLVLAALIGVAASLLSTQKPATAQITTSAKRPQSALVAGKPTMPQDVYDWLDHLRQTEDKKNALSQKQISQVMVEMTKLQGLGLAYGALDKNGNLDPDNLQNPTSVLGDRLGDLRLPWRDLIKYFESVPPPAECESLAKTYDDALDEVSGQMGDLGDALANPGDAQTMVQKLESLQGQSTQTIDAKFSTADDMVGQLCDEYDTKKWFKIKADPGSSMALGGGSMSGLPGTGAAGGG